MNHKKLLFKFELKAAPTEEGIFEGYAAVFNNVDQAQDVIQPGAFTQTLKSGRVIPICYQHDSDEVVGKVLEAKEDEVGLWIKAQLAIKTEDGNNVYELLKLGALTGLSIGYAIPTDGAAYKDGIRLLNTIEVYEISVVTFPCNTEATVTAVKASEMSEREFEKTLRDVGFTQKEAKTIISKGFKQLSSQRDEDADVEVKEQEAIKHAELEAAEQRLADEKRATAELVAKIKSIYKGK